MTKSKGSSIVSPRTDTRTEAGLHSSRVDWARLGGRYGALVLLCAMFIGFSIALPDTFFSSANFKAVASQYSVPAMLAIGLLLPVMANEFDFSIGAVVSAAMVAMAVLTGEAGLSWQFAAILVLVGAGIVGCVNGILVAGFGLSSFVATLAVGGIVAGAALFRADGQVLYEGIPEGYVSLAREDVLGIPIPTICLIVVIAIVWFLVRQTPWGRYQEAIGKGRDAATLTGIPVRRQIILGFVGSALIAGFAGVVQLARIGSAAPDAGQGFLLSAYAAVFLGATMLRPGFFNVPGTIGAVLLLAIGINGLELLGVSSFVEQMFTGVVLLLAVGVSRLEGVFGRRS